MWVRKVKTERDAGTPAPTLEQPLLASVPYKHRWSAVLRPPGPDNDAARQQGVPACPHPLTEGPELPAWPLKQNRSIKEDINSTSQERVGATSVSHSQGEGQTYQLYEIRVLGTHRHCQLTAVTNGSAASISLATHGICWCLWKPPKLCRMNRALQASKL